MHFPVRTGFYCAALLMSALYLAFPFRLTVACGDSMAPTLKNGAVCVLDSGHYRRHEVSTDDVVVFRHADTTMVKRVAAVEGETVYLVLQNEEAEAELVQEWQLEKVRKMMQNPHWRTSLKLQELTVPPGMCFVVGDNPLRSEDSRNFGPIPLSSIRGKVLLGPHEAPETARIARAPRPSRRS